MVFQFGGRRTAFQFTRGRDLNFAPFTWLRGNAGQICNGQICNGQLLQILQLLLPLLLQLLLLQEYND
jgi:hypothetical protein